VPAPLRHSSCSSSVLRRLRAASPGEHPHRCSGGRRSRDGARRAPDHRR
jgi:hypothetical protein